jgi:hypothetical protein
MKADSKETDGTTLLLATQYEDADYLLAKQAREEKIRLRAYEIYLDRESRGGSDVEDWLKAEIECFSS